MATINLGAIKFNWKGAYNNSTAYAVDDVVSSGGSSYVCILASTGNATSNGTYWEQMSSAGTDLSTTLSTRGDLVFKGASALTRLPKGTSGYFLKQGANDPEWGAVDLTALSATSLTSGTIPNARYGTPTFNGSNLTNLPQSGKVKQVVVAANTTGQSTSSYDCNVSSIANNAGVTHIQVTVTPLSSSSKFIITASAIGGTASNGAGYAGIFVDGVCRGLTSGNGYANDSDGMSVSAFYDNTSTGNKIIQFKVLGTYSGYAHTLGSRRGGGTSAGSVLTYDGQYGNMQILEVE